MTNDIFPLVSLFSVDNLTFERITDENIEKYSLIVEIDNKLKAKDVVKLDSNDKLRLFAITSEGKELIGRIGIKRYRKWLYELRYLYVVESERNKGFGTKIVSNTVELIRATTPTEHVIVLASVIKDNEPSKRVFEKNAFRKVTTIKINKRAIIYEKVVRTIEPTDLTKAGFVTLELSNGEKIIDKGVARWCR